MSPVSAGNERRAQLVPAAQVGVSPFCSGVEVAETTLSPSRPECAQGRGRLEATVESAGLNDLGLMAKGLWLKGLGR